MICIKADIPKELNEIDDELKAIYHSKDTVCFYIFKTRDLRNEFVEKTKGMEKTQREEIYKQYLIWKRFYGSWFWVCGYIDHWDKLKCLLKKQWKKCKSWLFKNIKTTLETINLGPKQIKFLINIKNEKAFRDLGSGFVVLGS